MRDPIVDALIWVGAAFVIGGIALLIIEFGFELIDRMRRRQRDAIRDEELRQQHRQVTNDPDIDPADAWKPPGWRLKDWSEEYDPDPYTDSDRDRLTDISPIE